MSSKINYSELLFNRFFEDWSKLPVEDLKSLLRVKSNLIIPSLESKDIDFTKRVRVKLGIDVTGHDIHIGHLCPFLILNIFAKCGHHVDFVIGDFTAKVGDPSGRVSERALQSDADIADKLKTYVSQVSRFVDISKYSVRRNSEWLAPTKLAEFLGILQNLNLATIMQRDDFRARMDSGSGVTVAELCYGTLQALDSVALETNLELGGLDQLLNLQQCREVQKLYGQKPEVILCNPLVEGTDGTGRKMSKSFNNYIAVTAPPEDKFGKLMSIPDTLILQYFKSFGYLFESEIKNLEAAIVENPLELKKQLSTYFVAIEAKDLKTGLEQRAHFENKFSKKELVDSDFLIIKVKAGTSLIDALESSNKFKSRAEIKRLLASNSIRDVASNEVIKADMLITTELKIKSGKLNYFKIII